MVHRVNDEDRVFGTDENNLPLAGEDGLANAPLAALVDRLLKTGERTVRGGIRGKQAETATGQENQIDRFRIDESLQMDRLIVFRQETSQVFSGERHVLVRLVRIPFNNLVRGDDAVFRAQLLVLDPLSANGMELSKGRLRR